MWISRSADTARQRRLDTFDPWSLDIWWTEAGLRNDYKHAQRHVFGVLVATDAVLDAAIVGHLPFLVSLVVDFTLCSNNKQSSIILYGSKTKSEISS